MLPKAIGLHSEFHSICPDIGRDPESPAATAPVMPNAEPAAANGADAGAARDKPAAAAARAEADGRAAVPAVATRVAEQVFAVKAVSGEEESGARELSHVCQSYNMQ